MSVVPTLEAARRSVFLPRVMQALPLRGYRSFDEFALLAPGVLPPPQTFATSGPGVSPGVGTTGQFSVNGIRSRENNFTMDGSDNNDEDIGTRRQGFVSLTPQPVETLQEFQVITALADARYGRNDGGQVNALTRSGSYGFHGSLYGFYTDDRLSARDFFDRAAGSGPASFALTRASDDAPVTLDGRPLVQPNPSEGQNKQRRVQAGFLLSGRIPWSDTFYFGSLERRVNRETRESHFAVPTVRQRGVFDTGDTGLLAGGAPTYPATIPGDAIFSLYPFPNDPLGPYGQNTYTTVLPADSDATLLTAKLGRRFGAEDSKRKRPLWDYFLPLPMRGDLLTGRYNFTQDKSLIPATGGAISSSLRPRVRTQNYAFFLNRTFSARTFDTIRFSFGRTKLFLLGTPAPLPSAALPGVRFLLNAPLVLNVTAPGGPPAFVSAASPQGAALLGSLGYGPVTQSEQVTGPLGQVWLPGFSPVGVDVYNFPQTRANNTIQIADTIEQHRKRHTFTFGGDVRKTHINSTLERNFRPFAQFDGLLNSGSPLDLRRPGGNPVDQRLLSPATLAAAGVPTGLFQTIAPLPDSTIGIRFTQVNFFAQDDWNVKPNLRLSAGVRYELNTVPDTVGKKLEKAFDPEEFRQLAQQAAAGCAIPGGCADFVAGLSSYFPSDFKLSFGSDRNDLDARLGFAFDAWGLRGPYNSTNAGKLVIRGGFGAFSGQFPGIVLSQSRNAFPDFLPLNFANFSARIGDAAYLFNPVNPSLRPPNSPLDFLAPGSLNTFRGANPLTLLAGRLTNLQQFALSPTVLGLDLVLPQNQLKTSYALQYGLSADGLISDTYYWSVAYVGTRGLKLPRLATPDRGTNNSVVNLSGVGRLGATAFPAFSGNELPAQSRVISQSFAVSRTLYESSASSAYNSLQVELRKRFVRHTQLGSAFTYSHTLDDASDLFDTAGAFALPQNSLSRSEKASSNFDTRLRSATYFLWNVAPDSAATPAGMLLGDWSVSGIFIAQTGQPYTLNTAFDVNRDGNLTDRPATTAGLAETPRGQGGDLPVRLFFAPGVAPSDLLAPPGLDGAVGRNTFVSPIVVNLDLAVTKNLNFGENRFSVRMEVFNALNRTHFAIPERILESPAFGSSVRTILPPRTVQFELKYSF